MNQTQSRQLRCQPYLALAILANAVSQSFLIFESSSSWVPDLLVAWGYAQLAVLGRLSAGLGQILWELQLLWLVVYLVLGCALCMVAERARFARGLNSWVRAGIAWTVLLALGALTLWVVTATGALAD